MKVRVTPTWTRPTLFLRSLLITAGIFAAGGLLQAQYCEAGGTNSAYFIRNVSTTGAYTNITNLNSGFSTAGYGDFTDMVLTVSQGMTVNFVIDFEAGTQGVNIWVDWNNDFDFDDQDEKIWSAGTYISSPAAGSVLVTPQTPLGTYRMRVRNHWLSTDPAPCGIIEYGEVEDYTLVVAAEPSCMPPSNVVVSNLSPNGGNFSWTAGGPAPANGYNWEIRTSDGPGTGSNGLVDSGTASSTSTSSQALEDNTYYIFYVQADCDGEDQSFWAAKSFQTPCDAQDVPYFEDFNDTPVPMIPNCMAIETNHGNAWKTALAPTGMTGNAAYVTYTLSGTGDMDSWLFTAGLNLTGGQSYRLTYKYTNNSTYYTERMMVGWGSVPMGLAITHILIDYPSINDGLVHEEVLDFTPNTSGVYYIGFQCYSEDDQLSLIVDDISVTTTPTCLPPTGLSHANVTWSSADFSWAASSTASASGYNWELRTSGDPGSGPTDLVDSGNSTGTSASTSNLEDNTTYQLYVQADCGNDDGLSTWKGPHTFRTPCLATDVPYTEDFQTVVAPALPTCMSVGTNIGNPWTTVANPFIPGFTGPVAQVEYTTSGGPMNSWLFTQGLNLTGGTPYRLAYKYGNGASGTTESMSVSYGTGNTQAAMTHQLADHPAISNATANTNMVEFTPDEDGVYYIGFKCYSAVNQYYLYLDDIEVYELVYCAGTPDPGATTGPASACPGVPLSLTFSNDPGFVAGYSFQWQASSDSLTWANGTGSSTGTSYSTTQMEGTWYRVQMVCSGGDTAYSEPIFVAITPPNQCYCNSNFTDVSLEHITHVSFGEIDNASSGNTGGPVDYTDQVAHVTQGEALPLSVTIVADVLESIYAFIDWNQNGILNDPGEMYTVVSDADIPGPHTISITVPTTALPGPTRMRVMMGFSLTNPTPCHDGIYGEAEDYTVEVAPAGDVEDCLGELGGPALPGTPCISDAGYGGLWSNSCICIENVGLEEIAAGQGIALHPNPANSELFITTPNGLPVHVKVFDMLGQLVLGKDQATRLDVAPLAPGTYSLLIMDGQGNPQFRARFVKQ